jgi:hypothetical protein
MSPPSRRPTREEAFEAFCTLLAFVGGGHAPATYDQRPGHLPPDAKSADSYKRRHRALRKAGVAGCWVRGKLLCCTAEAWASATRKVVRRPPLSVVDRPTALDDELAAFGLRRRQVAPATSINDELDAAFGIRTRR